MVPADLHPRILDYASINFNAQVRQTLFRSQHFALGLDASQDFLSLTSDRFRDLRDELAGFAPHPFERYTFTFWVGEEGGAMVECLCIVQPHPDDGTPLAAMSMMRWGDRDTINHATAMMSREDALGKLPETDSDPTLEYHRDLSMTAWRFVDVFRLLMARRQGVMVNQGGAPRSAMRKGKRVHFYSSSQITIDLDAVKERKVATHNGHGKSPSAYQYRAHLCHSGGRTGCDHFWVEIGGRMDANNVWQPDAEYPRQNATWECYHCGRHRWHRRAGQRGDASKGFVKQTYRVVKGESDLVPA